MKLRHCSATAQPLLSLFRNLSEYQDQCGGVAAEQADHYRTGQHILSVLYILPVDVAQEHVDHILAGCVDEFDHYGKEGCQKNSQNRFCIFALPKCQDHCERQCAKLASDRFFRLECRPNAVEREYPVLLMRFRSSTVSCFITIHRENKIGIIR